MSKEKKRYTKAEKQEIVKMFTENVESTNPLFGFVRNFVSMVGRAINRRLNI